MSRPIFSRPRTRVYGCNYDKGESYYKPMVDHLDRKYSSRPLFSEPRSSFADEIAARRSDIGTRSLADSRLEDIFDDADYYNERREDNRNTRQAEEEEEDFDVDEFIASQRRMKQRAMEAFDRDLAELRKKRRDMQDKMFDMIDMNAEIERAKTTLEGANSAFSKHATKFNNGDLTPIPPVAATTTLIEKIERNRKIQAERNDNGKSMKKKPLFQWTKMQEIENDPVGLVEGIYNRRARINSILPDDVATDGPLQFETSAKSSVSPPPKEKTKKKRSVIKRKKTVSF